MNTQFTFFRNEKHSDAVLKFFSKFLDNSLRNISLIYLKNILWHTLELVATIMLSWRNDKKNGDLHTAMFSSTF